MDSLKGHASGKISPYEIFQLQAPVSHAKRKPDDSASVSVPQFGQPSKRQNFFGGPDTSGRHPMEVQGADFAALFPCQESSWNSARMNDCINSAPWDLLDVNVTPTPHEHMPFKGGEGPSHYAFEAAGNAATSGPRSHVLSGDTDEAFKGVTSCIEDVRQARRRGESDLMMRIATLEGERARLEARHEDELKQVRSRAAKDVEEAQAQAAKASRELAELQESLLGRENRAFNQGVRSGCEMLKEAVGRMLPHLDWTPILKLFQSILARAAGVPAEGSQPAGDGPGGLTDNRQG